MNTKHLSITTDPKITKKAQKTAEELGISFGDLSTNITNTWLASFAELKKKKKIGNTITLRLIEKSSEYFKKTIKQAEEERKKGKSSPIFHNAEDGIRWLNR